MKQFPGETQGLAVQYCEWLFGSGHRCSYPGLPIQSPSSLNRGDGDDYGADAHQQAHGIGEGEDHGVFVEFAS